MQRRLLAILSIVAVGGAAVCIMLARRSDVVVAPSEPTIAGDPQLEQRMARVERLAAAAVQGRAPQAESPPSANPEVMDEERSEEARGGESQARAPELAPAELQARMAQRFEEEPFDPSWSRQAEALVAQQMTRGLGTDARVVSRECRQSMCRAEVEHRDVEAHREHARSMLQDPSPAWRGPLMGTILEELPGGRVRTELFFVRPGENPIAEVLREAADEMGPP